MKKLFFIVLSCLILSSAFAQDVVFLKKKGCNPDENEIGDRTEYATANNVPATDVRCFLYTPECSGTLSYANVYHLTRSSAGDDDNVDIGVFSDDGDSAPDAGDLFISSSGAIQSLDDASDWFQSAGELGGSVSTGTNVWICLVAGPNEWNRAWTTTGTRTQQYLNSDPTWYNNWPANLDGTWSTTADRDMSVYVEIE